MSVAGDIKIGNDDFTHEIHTLEQERELVNADIAVVEKNDAKIEDETIIKLKIGYLRKDVEAITAKIAFYVYCRSRIHMKSNY
ncbi:unnamed protein product [Adineta steineri]|uniref:Uncharacterized protein n=1 Tax=Adineta steineri TaxID=433720 RepID=A0A815B715_9BILA|nr:unnamed protein product [Adineta steineri]CAF4155841.1 unnamed protein product [Adineta steineri]